MDLPPLQEIARTHPDPAYGAAVDAFIADISALPEYGDANPDHTLTAALGW
jgi:hypothetical protein